MKLDVFKFTKAVRLLSGLVGLVIIIFPQSALELFLPSLDRRREFFLRNCISTDQPNMSYTFGTLRETNLIGPVKKTAIFELKYTFIDKCLKGRG